MGVELCRPTVGTRCQIMRSNSFHARASLVALLFLAAPCAGIEPEEVSPEPFAHLKAILGYHYSTGKYGTSDRTEIAYVPLTLRGEIRRWTLSVTIPYIRIDGSSEQVIEGGIGPVLSTNADGLGDIVASLGYLITPPRAWLPFLELRTRIKFPTASESAGLGTGEFDYSLEAELSQVLGPITPYLEVGYRFLGNPKVAATSDESTGEDFSQFDLNDVWLASAGAVYDLSQAVDVGLFFYFREASSRATDAQLEALPYVEWDLTEHWSTSGYVSAGILDGSPDVGVGLQVSLRY
jgi:hypothetical protein